MRNDSNMTRLLAALLASSAVGIAAEQAGARPGEPARGPSSVRAAGVEFTSPARITNPWLPLSAVPAADLRGTIDGRRARSLRRMVPGTETFRIAGRDIRAAVTENRDYVNGVLREVALVYYAQADDGTVYHLGKDVDRYDKAGLKVLSHEGSFRYGRDTDFLGVAMPAYPRDGMRYTFGSIPAQGVERDLIIDTNGRLGVLAGAFHRVLEVRGLLLPEGEREVKWYARGVGLLKEQRSSGAIELVSRG